jgi:Dockerin type I domain
LANSRTCGGNPEGYWEKLNRKPTGQWTYTQIIKVVDNEAPQIFTESNVSFCINRSDCKADIILSVGIQEACDPNNLNIDTDLKLEVNESSSSSQTNWRIFGRYPKYLFTGVVPKGDYQLEIKVSDACGNTGRGFVKFKVVDCKPPAVTCIHGLSAELSELPPNTDVDGDGDVDRASTIVWAKELLASPSIDSCSGPVRYSINRKGEKANINQDYIILTCDDLGLTEVELHAWDNAINTKLSPPGPNHDFCLTYIKVQDNKFNLCKDPGDTLIIEGNTRTELGLNLSGVVVESSGAKNLKAVSVQTGDYLMQGLAQGYDYTLTADKEDDATNGVTTFDVLLITKHILGKQRLTSPYQLLAADVNQSGSISTIDLIKIRRVILHLDTTFEGGKSWLFVDAKHRFKDPNNPWAEAIPKFIQFNDLDRSVSDARFIGIKLGDVNGNVETNGLTQLSPAIIKNEVELTPQRPQLDFRVLSVHPNPFRDQVQIKWSSPSGGEAILQVIDTYGRTVRQDRVNLFVGENNFAYAQQDLPGAGTYSVIIRHNGQQVITRLLMVN